MDMFSTLVYALIWMKTAYPSGAANTEQRTQFASQRILYKIVLWWRGGDKLLNKVIIFVFFAHKKYSRRFIKFILNHWWQMDYFDDVFHTFLGLDSVNYLAVKRTVKPPVLIQNILNCVYEEEWSFCGFGNDTGASEKWQHFRFGVE